MHVPDASSSPSSVVEAGGGDPAPPMSSGAGHDARLWPFVLPFVAAMALPGLYRQSEQFLPEFRLVRYLNATALVVVVGLLVLLALAMIGVRPRRRLVGTATAVVLTLFMWPLLTEMGRTLAVGSGLPIGDLVPVAFALLLITLSVRLGESRLYLGAMAMLSAVLLLATAWPLLKNMGDDPAAPPVTVSVPSDRSRSPDVWFVVLDAYGRGDVLRDQYGFDNSAFLRSLEERGFVVGADAASTYTFTAASISGMLSLGTHVPAGEVTRDELALIRRQLSGDNALFGAFSGAGYDVWFLESYWDGLNCSAPGIRCERVGMTTANLFDLADMTVFRPLLRSLVAFPYGPQGLAQLGRLAEIAELEAEHPRLVFAHVTLPHPPLNVTSDCAIALGSLRGEFQIGLPDFTEKQLQFRRVLYTDQVACLNERVIEAVDAMLRSDRESIVVITGDHGPDAHAQLVAKPTEWTDEALIERFGVLLALRMPGDCGAADVSSPTNALRMVTNCALGTHLEPLPAVHLATDIELPLTLVDVTRSVRESVAAEQP
jgi:hypothetical protein